MAHGGAPVRRDISMASIGDLCWTSSEELFSDIDLDDLYARQILAIGADRCPRYPYLLLVFTGKITIGINMGNKVEAHGHPGLYDGADGALEHEDTHYSWNP
jgi:hypothetical protein